MRSKKTSFFNQSGIFTTGFGIALIVISLAGLAMSFSIINRPVTHVSYAASCGCSPPPDTHGWTDNMCFFPPDTNGCPQTFPGGYCDPNGDKSYEDANWIQGYNDYKKQCGKTSPSPASPTSNPGNTNPTATPASGNSGTPAVVLPTVTTAPGASTTPAGFVTPTYLPSATPNISVTPTYLPTATPTRQPTPTPLPELCKIIRGSKDNFKDKYDLVFIPYSYSDVNSFIADVNEAVNYFQSTNIGLLFGKFNFIAHTNTGVPYNATFQWQWDFDRAMDAMRTCNGDGYVLLVHTPKASENAVEADKVAKLYRYIGGKATGFGTGKVMLLRLSLDGLSHELGHSIAGLLDEYDKNFDYTGSKEHFNYPNCSIYESKSEKEPCPPWKDKYPDAGCYKVCSFSNAYRSTENSIMRKAYLKEFSPLQLDYFKKVLEKFK